MVYRGQMDLSDFAGDTRQGTLPDTDADDVETQGDSEGAGGGREGWDDPPEQCIAIAGSTGERCGNSPSGRLFCSMHADKSNVLVVDQDGSTAQRSEVEGPRELDDDLTPAVVRRDDGPTPRTLDDDLAPAVTRREG